MAHIMARHIILMVGHTMVPVIMDLATMATEGIMATEVTGMGMAMAVMGMVVIMVMMAIVGMVAAEAITVMATGVKFGILSVSENGAVLL